MPISDRHVRYPSINSPDGGSRQCTTALSTLLPLYRTITKRINSKRHDSQALDRVTNGRCHGLCPCPLASSSLRHLV
ncbi:hypothetical protein HBI56_235040 [Parastagonospora nodorum]|uniref:Uncharacterized protein n=1 Tax=Phaeosphaeria nodorum (strain SN15 / ATCC MYA-4574 / FGSC 10173) TaxID=321614 RepID=A0A7U2F3C6_PHANO|nr:hypothetical protein HBH56_227710 [Parastagonospora nodorum]QRC95764.1 hypothetical protein JI435_407930 [Parastagonospora nodorum SN15]KAH3921747.1 hypothetical protein HBH54_235070 [Parastagonospora nodorum]KAH3938932.1 hypothetical protein HBH53_243570 [Parastagonospora nodorum]KAH3959005.1 hypothetical protein HBH51_203520 [Parastagonospora nodorum]